VEEEADAPLDRLESMAEPKAILVVEDEILIRLTMAEELADAGFRVIQATTADEALKVLHSAVAVDLLLTDIRMPGMVDGLELARLARANRPGLKIIVMSSHLPTAESNIPADVFLAKPYPWAEVVECVNQLFGGVENDG
jgi:CheY-like chemotaxis protein